MADDNRAETLGWEQGQTALYSSETGTAGQKRPLESGRGVLPELAEAQPTQRSMWRHPAFLISIITTGLALVAVVVIFVVGILRPSSTPVTDLSLSGGDTNVRLSWSGGDEPYSAYVIDGRGDAVDVSARIRGGSELWLPVALGLYDDDSCFVVRPAAVTAQPSLVAQTLADQGGQSVCMER
ncbi:hypothetical protein [Mycetocola reblochoni]|uniref:Uncharacterized protein n=2 Tax=Mycetocola reblochoni TaxID=331618 RepID=A0A1R4K2H4_9MICO|nr:hypothetical protein [Mycetocola reblochoni]RLP67691.1 hypothetical protein D9V30_13165 [Mycetocola reblochoni]SJN38550.1 hypothetical protein FM119_10995 [Mycetocola reblochoni REB411]